MQAPVSSTAGLPAAAQGPGTSLLSKRLLGPEVQGWAAVKREAAHCPTESGSGQFYLNPQPWTALSA